MTVETKNDKIHSNLPNHGGELDVAVVLVIEDEANVAALICTCLENEGHICHTAADGETGLECVRTVQPDVVILDLMLPKMNGLDVCAQIRQSSKLGQKDPYIMMLTGKGEEIDRIIGFSTGADDYMVKPFSPVELTVRLRALLRREMRSQTQSDEILETRHLRINKDTREVMLKSAGSTPEGIKLTTLEFDLLATLASRPGRVWTRSQLLDEVWGVDFVGDDRIVDSYVKRIRQKLSKSEIQKLQFIHTAPGIGYSFSDSNGTT